MAKKKKRNISKRRARAREKNKRKRNLRLVKSRAAAEPKTIQRPGLPHMGAPEGFRSISTSQAMMEYAKPLFEFAKDEENAFNETLQISMLIWNYSISIEEDKGDKKIESEILKSLVSAYSLKKNEAAALLRKMIDRYAFLFPKDKQPEPGLPFMFIRKEVHYLIKPFDYNRLTLSNEIFPADQEDAELIEKIEKLDGYIENSAEYSSYEDLLFSLHDECRVRFEKWLSSKDLKENIQDFSHCLQPYLDFIYGYMHDDTVVLKAVPDIYFLEFFEDYLLRKMMVEPREYVYWPPALKLFYLFLHEKGYLGNPGGLISKIDKVEPYFIEVLRKQFS
ncbi:MAG: hypothetical protein ACE5DO_02445 [Desulfobacterales bacterium]